MLLAPSPGWSCRGVSRNAPTSRASHPLYFHSNGLPPARAMYADEKGLLPKGRGRFQPAPTSLRGSPVRCGEGLVRGGAPDYEVPAARVRPAGDAGIRRYPDLPRPCAALDLLYAVRVHPDAGAAAARVAAAGGHGVGALNADVRLVEVQPLALLDAPCSSAPPSSGGGTGYSRRTYSRTRAGLR